MFNNPYFDQLEQNIRLLLSEEKFREAYKICIEAISKYPEEKKFLKLKETIEKAVEEKNEKLINKKIGEISHFWKEEKYGEILKELRPLLQIGPNNKHLKSLIVDAQDKYEKQIKVLQINFQKTQTEKFEKLLKEDENQLVQELLLLERSNPQNKLVQNITTEFRDKLIKKKIKEKEDLIYSDKFADIKNFIDQLKKIDDANKEILELEKFIKERQLGTQVEDQNEFLYKSEEHLFTLMRLKKYDKAVKVAEEILELDKNNKKVFKMLKEAESYLFSQTRDESINAIQKNLPELKTQYAKEPDKFIKI